MKIKVVMKIVNDHSLKEEDVVHEHEDDDEEEVTKRTDLSTTNVRSMATSAMNVGRSQQIK